jgi:transcriptional regulator with XRE-family HTH domain
MRGKSKPVLPIAADTIKNARRRCGISQAELAKRLGVSQSAVSDWEFGKKDPSVSNLFRIVATCGLELRLNAILPTEQEKLQAKTDYYELASGNANLAAEQIRNLVAKYGLGPVHRAS